MSGRALAPAAAAGAPGAPGGAPGAPPAATTLFKSDIVTWEGGFVSLVSCSDGRDLLGALHRGGNLLLVLLAEERQHLPDDR